MFISPEACPGPSQETKGLPRARKKNDIDELMDKAIKARSASEVNALIDKLGKFGDDATSAIQEVVERTKFEEVRAHGLQAIRDIKFEDTQF
jgi:hypothetical protein